MTVEAMKVQDLPEDCRLNIQSFLIGKPEHLRIKGNRSFRVFQLRCKFRHFVHDTKAEYDYTNDNKFCFLYKEYDIMSLLYTPKTILKEQVRFEEFFGETMNELFAHKDYNVYLQSFTPHWKVQIETRKHVYYFSEIAYGEDGTMESFLVEAVEHLKQCMDRDNEKHIEKIRFSVIFEID